MYRQPACLSKIYCPELHEQIREPFKRKNITLKNNRKNKEHFVKPFRLVFRSPLRGDLIRLMLELDTQRSLEP